MWTTYSIAQVVVSAGVPTSKDVAIGLTVQTNELRNTVNGLIDLLEDVRQETKEAPPNE